MTNDYVKQLKLTKQLEQKAKEATKNRTAAEERLKEAEGILSSAKKIGAETEAPENAYKEAYSLFCNKNYAATLTAADKAIGVINTARKLKVMEILTESEEILKRTGEDQAVRDVINKSHTLADEGKLDEAYEIASQANRMADKYSTARITELLGIAESLVTLLRNFEQDYEARQSEVNNIKKLIEKGDQKEAHEKLLAAIKEASEPLGHEFELQQEELQKKCELASHLGLDASKSSGTLIKASEKFEENNIVEAFELLKKGRNEFSFSVPPQIQDAIARLRGRAEFLRERHFDVSSNLNILDSAKESNAPGSLEESLESMKKAMDSIREIELDIILLRISKLRPRLALAKKMNADLAGVVDKLDQARDSFAVGNLRNALHQADAADELLEARISGFKEADSELTGVIELLGYCRRLKVKVNGARELFNSSRQIALTGDLAAAVQKLKETQQSINFSLQSNFASHVMDSELQYAKALRMGTDVEEETQQLDRLIAAIKGRNYSEAPILISNFNDALSSKIASRTFFVVDNAENAMKEGMGLIDTSSASAILREAEAARNRGEFEVAFTLANRSLETLRKLEIASLETERKKTLNILDMLHRLKMDETGIKESLKRAKKESKSPRAEISILRESRANAEEILREVVYQSLMDLDRTIDAAKRNGVYVTRSSRLSQDGIKALQGGDLEKAFLHYKEAEAEVARNTALHTEVYNLIIKLNSITNEISIVDSKDLMESLKDAKVMFEKGRYKEAKEGAKICYTQIEREHAARIAPQYIKDARDLMWILNQVDPNSSRFEPELAEVQRLIDSGNANNALSEGKKVTKRLSAALHASTTKELDHVKELKIKADEVCANTLPAQDIISKAQRLIEEKRFSDALQAVRFARAELNQLLGLKMKTIEDLEDIQTEILDLDDIADISSSMEILGQAWSHQAAGRLGIASELGKKAVDHAKDAARKHIEEQLEIIEKQAIADNLGGSDLEPELKKKETIIQRSNEGALREAIAMVYEWERIMQRLRVDRKLAQKRLSEARNALGRAEKLGLEIPSIDTMCSLAEEKFNQGAFSDSISLSIQVLVDLEFRVTLLNKVMPRIRATHAQITSYGDWLPKDEILSYLEEAERSLLSGDQHEAILSMDQASKAQAAAAEHFIDIPVADLLNLLRYVPQLRIKTSEIPKEVSKCLDIPLKRISISQADSISKAASTMRSFLIEKTKKKSDGVAALINKAREMKSAVSVSDSLLQNCRASLKKGELEDAINSMLDAERYIGLTAEEINDLRVKAERCEEFIKEGRALGLDMNEAVKLLKESSQEKTDLHRALDKIKKAEDLAGNLVRTMKPNLKLSLKEQPQAETDGWVHAVINVENDSDLLAHDLVIKFAEQMEVKEFELPPILRAGEKKVLDGYIKCTDGSNHILMELTYRPLTSQVSLATILPMNLPAS